jgi:hypothetical protein
MIFSCQFYAVNAEIADVTSKLIRALKRARKIT